MAKAKAQVQERADPLILIVRQIQATEGQRLAQLMIDHDVGVTETARYVVKKVDQDYFDE